MIGFTKYEPWERWPDETDTAYHRFTVYLELGGDRSLRATREKLGKTSGYERQLQTWSSKYGWVDRARKYDQHIIGKALKDREKYTELATGKMLKQVGEVTDRLICIALGETEGVTQTELKAIEMIFDRVGIVPVKSEDKPIDDTPTYNEINNYFAQKVSDSNEMKSINS